MKSNSFKENANPQITGVCKWKNKKSELFSDETSFSMPSQILLRHQQIIEKIGKNRKKPQQDNSAN